MKRHVLRGLVLLSLEVDTDAELPSSGKFVIHNGVAAIFTSPDYPNEYPANVWTTWIFEAQDEDAKLHISCPELSLGRRSRLTLRTEDGGRQVFFHNSISPPALTSTSRVTASLRAGRTDNGKMACVVRAELTPQVSLDDLAPVEVNDPLCGRAKPITRIVGGVTAEKGAYPWLVGVTTRSREDMFCGGSIINERYILTAAHCVHGRKVWAVNVQVRKHKRGKDVDELRYKVKRFIEHPGYSRATLQNDIALIELEESLRIQLRRDPRVRPICLPSEPCRGGDGPACFDGRTGAVAGWGVLRERSKDYPENLQEVELPVLTSQDCRDSQPEVITDEMLCTSYEYGGKDACQGDSGGPLTVADGDGLASQVGIVSFGKGCGHKEYPAVYVRVSGVREVVFGPTVAVTKWASQPNEPPWDPE
ncbi:Trypsin II-P29 [Amphibalanus amphitrite]|uniref:limulus clotting factor C n=1 Tax=Amphibalanus amphitrite TaxID=1232801 RepID=A0A6A4VEU3_AMPAM|nr:Trypsin II-P29 [Amphibalanus amphitrite]